VFFQALNTLKLVFGRGSAPDPAGELTTLPRRLERGTPSTYTYPLDAFGCQAPNTIIPGYAYDRRAAYIISCEYCTEKPYSRQCGRGLGVHCTCTDWLQRLSPWLDSSAARRRAGGSSSCCATNVDYARVCLLSKIIAH